MCIKELYIYKLRNDKTIVSLRVSQDPPLHVNLSALISAHVLQTHSTLLTGHYEARERHSRNFNNG